MRRLLAALMALLVVHLQVANAACICLNQNEGQGHAHGREATGAHPGGHKCTHHKAPGLPGAPDDEHPHGGCECAPAQPIIVQDSNALGANARQSASLPFYPEPGSWVRAHVESIGLGIALQARPPPLACSVSSTSPKALPKLQI